MGIAIGQIIGAGVMSLTGVAIAMTGRTSNFAFLVSALFVLATAIPLVFVNSCIRMRGGAYTQTSVFLVALLYANFRFPHAENFIEVSYETE